MSQKMDITISFKSLSGDEEKKSITVEVDVPDVHEFESIDQFERIMLKARKEASTKATELYLEEMSKKKPMLKTKATKGK